jgi:hypothetical protein
MTAVSDGQSLRFDLTNSAGLAAVFAVPSVGFEPTLDGF